MGVSSISSNEAHAYELAIHDPLGQTVISHQVRRLEDGSTVVLPVTVRYAWPAEMDLMGRLAGLESGGALGLVRPETVHRTHRSTRVGLQETVEH